MSFRERKLLIACFDLRSKGQKKVTPQRTLHGLSHRRSHPTARFWFLYPLPAVEGSNSASEFVSLIDMADWGIEEKLRRLREVNSLFFQRISIQMDKSVSVGTRCQTVNWRVGYKVYWTLGGTKFTVVSSCQSYFGIHRIKKNNFHLAIFLSSPSSTLYFHNFYSTNLQN